MNSKKKSARIIFELIMIAIALVMTFNTFVLTYELNSCAKSHFKSYLQLIKNIRETAGDNCFIVSKMGGYEEIQSAIDASNDGDTIIIMPGEYDENIQMFNLKRNLVGVSKESCIIKNGTNKYDTPPLEANVGSIENLTIIADDYDMQGDMDIVNDGTSYAVHADHSFDADNYELIIKNCRLISKWNAAIGIGVHYNQRIVVENCELISNAREKLWSPYTNNYYYMGALFVHNESARVDRECSSYLCVKGCVINGYGNALTLYSLNNGNGLTLDFIDNTLSSDIEGASEDNIFIRTGNPAEGCLDGEDIYLGNLSHGNNLDTLNY